jgi:hypothetical protein
VTSPGVVPVFYPGEDRHEYLRLALKAVALNEFSFQAGEEALGHCVVVCVTYCSHRRTDLQLYALLTKGQAGVMAALIRMLDDSLRFALLQRMFSAVSIRSVVMCSPMAQPTTRRLQTAMNTARYRKPIQIGI